MERDKAVFDIIKKEQDRQRFGIELIASENFVSDQVLESMGSCMTNKYAEGYPGKRYYGGCQFVDETEQLAIDRAKELFGAEHANLQPHCGTSANIAVYLSVLERGDTILSMDLSHGGHLSHGHPANISGRLFNIVSYGVERNSGLIDYDQIAALALSQKPQMIVAGASAYPRIIDFARFREIADSVGAYLVVDMAHIAGLIAGGSHPSPVPFADFVTSTSHKTLRGPRSGFILCRSKFAAAVDKQVFPGIQGGPQMHATAAKAVCFREAMQPEFKTYTRQVVQNAAVMAETLLQKGLNLVSGGTDNHLLLVDLSDSDISGKEAAKALENAGIVLNKNTIPFDTESAFVTSGIRIGTPAVTTRGMGPAEMRIIATLVADVLGNLSNVDARDSARNQVSELTKQFPVP